MPGTFLDFSSDIDIGGPLIDFADAKPLIAPPPFMDAVEHWRFGGSAASLIGKVGGGQLRRGVSFNVTSNGSGYTSPPAVALDGAGVPGLAAFAERNGGGQIYSVGISGQPQNDDGAVTAVISGGGGTGATATASRGAPPTFNASSLIIPAGRPNGLITAIDDAAVYSEAYLIKRPAAGTEQRVGGTAMFTGGARAGAVGGDGFGWSTGNKMQLQTGSGIDDQELAPPASWVPDAFGVLIVTVSATTRTAMMMGPDGAATSMVGSGEKVVANPQRKRAIGGVHWDFGNPYRALEIGTFVNWNTSKSLSQMTAHGLDILYDAQARGLI